MINRKIQRKLCIVGENIIKKKIFTDKKGDKRKKKGKWKCRYWDLYFVYINKILYQSTIYHDNTEDIQYECIKNIQ